MLDHSFPTSVEPSYVTSAVSKSPGSNSPSARTGQQSEPSNAGASPNEAAL
ncbi:hypothetical protein D3C83_168590 [compost metagenome]